MSTPLSGRFLELTRDLNPERANAPYVVTIRVDPVAWADPRFAQAVAHELAAVRELLFAERDRQLKAREAFWQDLGRPPDAHLGAVGGE